MLNEWTGARDASQGSGNGMNHKRGLEILAVIPARGGSKGLPRKNIRDLCGKPLIAYSIEAALAARSISRVVVSTDDVEIAEAARAHGAETPFPRPATIAGDRDSIGLAMEHMLAGLRGQGYEPDAVVTLYPTCPFRTPGLLDYLCGQFERGFNSVITARRVTHGPYSLFESRDGLLAPVLADHAPGRPFERRYGLFQGVRFRAADRKFVHFIQDEIALVDIDTLEDFYLAEEIIRDGRFRFEN